MKAMPFLCLVCLPFRPLLVSLHQKLIVENPQSLLRAKFMILDNFISIVLDFSAQICYYINLCTYQNFMS